MKKIGMAGVIHTPRISKTFHNGGYTLVMKNLIETSMGCKIDLIDTSEDWSEYDIIIISEGANYKEGVWNIFGGVNQKIITKLCKLLEFKGKLFSIDFPIDYNDLIKKRNELKNLDFPLIPKIQPLKMNSLTDKLILGDSHTLSVYRPGYSISKNDGKTLHGFLKEGINSYLPENTKELVFYAGNIDVRFHIHNNGKMEAIHALVDELESQLKQLPLEKISLVSLLPIEDESRKIPGTGKYKGQNFCGSREERGAYSHLMNKLLESKCEANGWEFLKWNFGNELSFDDMESKQSVHIRPSSYMFFKPE